MRPFSEFLFFDSLRPETRACAVHELIFDGEFQLERFERALASAIQTTPMARAVVKWNENRSVSWILDENDARYASFPLPKDLYEYHEATWDDTFPDLESLDLTRRPGIRFLVFHDRSAARTRLLFQFHHATTDAAGANLFLEKVFRFYADPAFSPGTEFKPRDLEKIGKERWDFSTGFRATGVVCKFLLNLLNPFRPRILAHPWPSAQPGEAPSQAAPILRHEFSTDESARVFEAARLEGTTLTEYLLAKLLHASAHASPRGTLRVAIPINIRSATHDGITLSNIVSVLFLTRSIRSFRGEFSSACRKVHTILNREKRRHSSKFLLLLVRALRDLHVGPHDIRWGFRHFLCRKEPLTTLVFSSLGRVFLNFPTTDFTLLAFRPIPPRIVSTSLQVVVSTYSDRLSVTIHVSSDRVNVQELEKWFENWCK